MSSMGDHWIMHDHSAEGNEFFKCDFCRKGWSEERPMVEGHQGSLICSSCLGLACVGQDVPVQPYRCVMCLREGLNEPCWSSPLAEGVLICRECVEKSASVLEGDPEYSWKRPN